MGRENNGKKKEQSKVVPIKEGIKPNAKVHELKKEKGKALKGNKNHFNSNLSIEAIERKTLADDFCAAHSIVIGSNLRSQRIMRSYTIEEFAEILGLSSSYVGLVERGDRCPSVRTILKLCKRLGLTPNDIFLEKDKKINVAEGNKRSFQDKLNSIHSLSQSLNEAEADLVINMLKQLINLNKNNCSVDGKTAEIEAARKIIEEQEYED